MWDESLRLTKERLLAPLALALPRYLPACISSPNALTLVAFALGLASVACCATAGGANNTEGWWWAWALVFWLFNRLVDGLDGVVARQTGRQTDFGGYLDLMCDFTVYALLPVAIVYSHTVEACATKGGMSPSPPSKNTSKQNRSNIPISFA